MAWTSSESAGSGRWAWESVRRMFEHDGVAVVGLAASDGVAVPVAGHGHRVDWVDLPPGGAKGGGQQPARGLDRHRDGIVWAVAMFGEQGQQRGQAGCVIADSLSGQQSAISVDQGDVVVILGPVDAAENVH